MIDADLSTDLGSFHFVLQSKDKRYPHPLKFEIKDEIIGGCLLYSPDDDCLIEIGDIDVKKKNHRENSWCCPSGSDFDYHGMNQAMRCEEKPLRNLPFLFHLKSIVVFQFE